MSDDPIRVLVFSHANTAWGAQLRLLEQAVELRELGVELQLACPPGGILAERWRELGLHHVELRIPPHQGLRDEAGAGRPSVPALAGEAAAVLRSSLTEARLGRRVDVVQSHSLKAHLEVALAGRLARTPAVLDVHDLVLPGMGRRILHTAGRLSSACIANSSATAAMLPPERTTVIHPGVDVARFRPAPPDPAVRAALGARADDDLVVGIVGRFDPEKRIELAAAAVAELAPATGTRTVRLAVVGDSALTGDSYAEELRRELRAALGDRVAIVGRREDVPDVMRALDVLVNPNDAEPFGRTILEAQACGTPVVAMRGGGAPDMVSDDVTGLLVDPGDRTGLARAFARLRDDPALARRLGDAGRVQAHRDFSLAAQSAKVAGVYRRLAGRDAGPAGAPTR